MNNLFDQADVTNMLERIEKLHPGSNRQWGKMDVGQMLAHCAIALRTATGEHVMKRLFIGRIRGPLIKQKVLNEKPFSKSSPTDKSYIFNDDRNIEAEKQSVITALKKFYEGGPAQCTKHPHPFFGYYSPEQWAILQWKHLDHHLRQFGA